MTAEQLAFASTVAAIASAGFAFTAWRVAEFQKLAALPYIDTEHFRRTGYLRMSGQNADHWQIRSARILWPLSASIEVDDPIFDDGGSIVQPGTKNLGRSTGEFDQSLSSSSDSAVWLLRTDLKCAPCKFRLRMVKIEKRTDTAHAPIVTQK